MGNEGFFRVTMVAMGTGSGAAEREAMLGRRAYWLLRYGWKRSPARS